MTSKKELKNNIPKPGKINKQLNTQLIQKNTLSSTADNHSKIYPNKIHSPPFLSFDKNPEKLMCPIINKLHQALFEYWAILNFTFM